MTRFLQLLTVGALLACSAAPAGAGFTYESSPSDLQLISGANSGGFAASAASNPLVPASTPSTITLLTFGIFSTAPASAPENFAYSLTDTVSITNAPPPGRTDTQSLALSIVLSFSNVNASNAGTSSTITINGVAGGAGVTATVLVGDYYYTLSNFAYTAPTSNVTLNGRLTALVTAVPEPGSLALLGVAGGLGLAGLSRRRARVAR